MKHYTRDEIYQSLKKHEGVNLAFTDEDRKRALANPYLKERFEGLISAGDYLRTVPTPILTFSSMKRFEADGNRTEFEHDYFLRRNKLLTYACLAWFYGKEEDIVELENICFEICNEYTWSVSAHLRGTLLTRLQEDGHMIDLFAAETASALAETLALVGDKLEPVVRMRIERNIEERIFSRAFEKFHWSSGSRGNWVAVCAGSVGMAAMYMMKDTNRLADLLAHLIEVLHNYNDGFADDGCCTEGVGYWNYGFGFFAHFAEMLRRLTGGEIDLFDDPKFKAAAEGYQKYFMTGVRSVVFADSGSGAHFSAFNCFLAKEYDTVKIPPVEYFNFKYPTTGCFRFVHELRCFVWCDDDIEKRSESLVGANIFENAQWYIAFSESGVGFAAKAGHNGEFHNHNDVGSFQLYKNGETMLADIGSGEYVKAYFGERRYEFFCNSSASHNLPVVNGKYQSKGMEHGARDVVMSETGIRADIAGAYDDETLLHLVRDITFDTKSGVATITDEVEFTEQPTAYSERFITVTEPTLTEKGILIRTGEASCELLYDTALLDAKVTPVWDKAHRGTDRLTYVTDLTPKTLSGTMKFKFIIK